MKTRLDIKNDLAANGYNWPPDYKEILIKIWSKMETYFDDDEKVMSALWSSFKRYDVNMIGVVYITDKRTFTLEILDDPDSDQVRYLPFDSYSLEKIQFQPSKNNGLNYVSLQNDSFGNGITFGCPNRKVAEHFIETLKGRTNGEIEVLPESDTPLLANNEREQVVDEEAPTPEEHIEHKFEEKHEEPEKKIEDEELWKKAPKEAKEKEVVIKIVPPKPPKPKKIKEKGYGSKFKSKVWLLWFILPLCLVGAIAAILVLF